MPIDQMRCRESFPLREGVLKKPVTVIARSPQQADDVAILIFIVEPRSPRPAAAGLAMTSLRFFNRPWRGEEPTYGTP